MITVTTTTGSQQVNGVDWNINDKGYLTIVDDNGSGVASYAPGWLSIAGAGAIIAVVPS